MPANLVQPGVNREAPTNPSGPAPATTNAGSNASAPRWSLHQPNHDMARNLVQLADEISHSFNTFSSHLATAATTGTTGANQAPPPPPHLTDDLSQTFNAISSHLVSVATGANQAPPPPPRIVNTASSGSTTTAAAAPPPPPPPSRRPWPADPLPVLLPFGNFPFSPFGGGRSSAGDPFLACRSRHFVNPAPGSSSRRHGAGSASGRTGLRRRRGRSAEATLEARGLSRPASVATTQTSTASAAGARRGTPVSGMVSLHACLMFVFDALSGLNSPRQLSTYTP